MTPYAFKNDPLVVNGVPTVPFGSVSNALNVFCDELGFMVTYRSDRFGFNNPDHLWDGEETGLVLVGDSFTHGACVHPKDSYAAIIRSNFTKTINLGAGGSGSLIELGSLVEHISGAKPSVVLWFFSENDIGDLITEMGQPVLTRYLKRGYRQKSLKNRKALDAQLRRFADRKISALTGSKIDAGAAMPDPPIPAQRPFAAKAIKALFNRILLMSTIQKTREILINKTTAWRIAYFARIMRRSKQLVCGHGADLIFVYLPSRQNVLNDAFPWWKPIVVAAAKLNNFGVLDPIDDFRKYPRKSELFPRHFNAAGNRIVAAAVLEGLSRRRKSREHACS